MGKFDHSSQQSLMYHLTKATIFHESNIEESKIYYELPSKFRKSLVNFDTGIKIRVLLFNTKYGQNFGSRSSEITTGTRWIESHWTRAMYASGYSTAAELNPLQTGLLSLR